MSEGAASGVDVTVLLASALPQCVNVGLAPRMQHPFHGGAELPFADGTVRTLQLGDAAAGLSVRSRIQLLLECRRVLVPGAGLRLVEPQASATFATLARWATLVGLMGVSPADGAPGWVRRGLEPEDTPLVTIAIPSSNPRYFLECLDSAVAQTYPHLEILVSDDSEGEEIPAMAASRSHLRDLRVVRNPVRLRTRHNYEQCLRLARGRFIKFLNDDDVLEADCVATLVEAFRRIPGLTLATSHRTRIDADSRVLEDMPATRPVVDGDAVIEGVSLVNAAIMHGLNFIGEPSTALFRKQDFDPLSPFDGEHPFNFNGEEVRGAIDFAMWSRLLVMGNAAFFNRRLSRFRIHGEQAQARPDVMQRSIDGIRGLQRQWIELGLFRRWPPHLLSLRDYAGANEGEWRLAAARCLPAPPGEPVAQVEAWRATARHPFDFLVQS